MSLLFKKSKAVPQVQPETLLSFYFNFPTLVSSVVVSIALTAALITSGAVSSIAAAAGIDVASSLALHGLGLWAYKKLTKPKLKLEFKIEPIAFPKFELKPVEIPYNFDKIEQLGIPAQGAFVEYFTAEKKQEFTFNELDERLLKNNSNVPFRMDLTELKLKKDENSLSVDQQSTSLTMT